MCFGGNGDWRGSDGVGDVGMSGKNDQYVNPLAKARGLGSAHAGVHHWINHRITAVAAIPLVIWLVWAMMGMGAWDHANFASWLSVPCNAVLMVLSVIALFYHAALGAQIIIEDYVHCAGLKIASLVGLNLFFFAAAVLSLFAVLKIALAG